MSIKPRDAFGPPFPDYAPPPKEDDIQKKKLQINESLKAVLQLVLSRQGGGVPIDAEAYFQNLREIVANLLFLQELTPHDTRQYGSYQRIIKKLFCYSILTCKI